MRSAVGFYWTLPVNWADFRSLPDDIEEAAKRSKTIQYQRAIVWQWAKEHACCVDHEVAYVDTRTDRATAGCKDALTKARKKCAGLMTPMIYVNFGKAHFWRRNPYIYDHAKILGFDPIDLSPEPIPIDGKLFDPIKHFETWRERDKRAKRNLREIADDGLLEAHLQFEEGAGRYKLMAEWLNGHGIKTATGKIWSAENVRKAIKAKIETDASEETEQAHSALPGLFD